MASTGILIAALQWQKFSRIKLASLWTQQPYFVVVFCGWTLCFTSASVTRNYVIDNLAQSDKTAHPWILYLKQCHSIAVLNFNVTQCLPALQQFPKAKMAATGEVCPNFLNFIGWNDIVLMLPCGRRESKWFNITVTLHEAYGNCLFNSLFRLITKTTKPRHYRPFLKVLKVMHQWLVGSPHKGLVKRINS